MSKWPEEFVQYVLEDVKKYNGIRKPIKANIIERLLVRKAAPGRLHPNPVDEFTWEEIGPNFAIVSNYEAQIRKNDAAGLDLFDEPLIVEKMSPDGYMLLNGHHRWFAALKQRIPKVDISIVNLTHEEDIIESLAKSSNTKCVAFDLDEILLSDGNNYAIENPKSLLTGKLLIERLRVGAPKLISALQNKGYDIWVYTASYRSIDHISQIFRLYDLQVNGIVNGTNRKRDKDAESANNLFNNKYEQRIHIDNESIVCTNTLTKEYFQIEFDGSNSDNWADNVKKAFATIV